MDPPSATIVLHFSDLDDPRRAAGRRHKLIDIIAITICGANYWMAIAGFGEAKETWLRTFLALPHGIPSHDTFHRVFAYILVMTKGGLGKSTWVLEYFIYQKAFPYSPMQIASAAAVMLLIFALLLMFLQARLRRQTEGVDV